MSEMPHPVGNFEPETGVADEFEQRLAEAIMEDNKISASAQRDDDGRVVIRAQWNNAKVKLTVDVGEDGETDWGAASMLLMLFPNVVLEVGPMLNDWEVTNDVD